jgi:hypothetical protein
MRLTLLIILISLFACNPQKKLEKAKQLVLTNKEAFNNIGDKWQQINPCADDTLIVNSSDTVNVINTFFSVKTDTINGIVTDTVTKTVTKTVKITDTIHHYITDNRALKVLQDTIVVYKIKVAEVSGQSNVYQSEAKKYKLLYRWALIIPLLLIVLFIIYRGLKYYYTRK